MEEQPAGTFDCFKELCVLYIFHFLILFNVLIFFPYEKKNCFIVTEEDHLESSEGTRSLIDKANSHEVLS